MQRGHCTLQAAAGPPNAFRVTPAAGERARTRPGPRAGPRPARSVLVLMTRTLLPLTVCRWTLASF